MTDRFQPRPVAGFLPAAAALLALALAAGCSPAHDSDAAQQTLHVGNSDEPQELDPHIVTGNIEFKLCLALYEGLLGLHPQSLEPTPAVAKSWQTAKNAAGYVFHLRRNAKWSNGDPVTAGDFVYSWRRALLPGLGNNYAYMLYYLKNAARFHRGELPDFSLVGVRARDDWTLEVELENPTPFFLQLLTHQVYFPVHRAAIEKFGAADERGTRWTRPGNHVGNGPFRLREWRLNRNITMDKNPHYWGAAGVRLQRIVFHPVQNETTEERMFRTGQLHITSTVPADKTEYYQRERPEALKIFPYYATYYYIFNTRAAPLDDPRVRRALALAIDRRQIAERIVKAGQAPAFSFTPPGAAGYSVGPQLEYDAAQARQLLAAAGYPDGRGFPSMELMYNTSDGHRRVAIAIQQMWKTNLGVAVALLNQDWKVYLARRDAGDYQVARAGWIGDYLDPNTFLDMYTSFSGNNDTGWGNARYDALIAQAGRTADRQLRLALLREAEILLLSELPIMPIYTYVSKSLVSPRVRGWHPNILDIHPYQYLSLAPPANDRGR